MHHWLDRAILRNFQGLRPDTRIREIGTDDATNKYGYTYNVYYPEHLREEPVGVVRYKDKIHQFFHHARVGDPYLGPIHKEATKHEISNHSSSTEEEATDQLALRIRESLVIIDLEQPGSPERTREPWGPERMPTISPATYLTHQKQPQLQMATKTIARTLAETATQSNIAQQLSQPPEEPAGGTRGSGGSLPFGANQLNDEEAQVRATLINAFWRCLRPQRGNPEGAGPPDDNDLGGGGDSPDDEPYEAGLQDHIPIPQARDIKPMGSLPRIFDGDRARADAFLTEYLGYLMLNQGVPGFESPI